MTTLSAATARTDRLALGAALFTVAAWASAFVGIRSAGAHLSPGALTLMRLSIAAVALTVVMVIRRETMPSRRHLPRLIVSGILWSGVYNLALNAGERRVDAGTASMLVNIAPILIAIMAGYLLGEGFSRNLVLGLAIAFAGVTVIAIAISDGFSLSLGAILCFVAAVAYAISVIAQKPLLTELSGLSVTWASILIGLVVCLPFGPQLISDLGDAPPSAIRWSVYLGLVPTAIAFTTWSYALARTDAGKLGVTTYLVPPIAIFLGWAILDEVPPTLAFLGGALALAGVIISRRR